MSIHTSNSREPWSFIFVLNYIYLYTCMIVAEINYLHGSFDVCFSIEHMTLNSNWSYSFLYPNPHTFFNAYQFWARGDGVTPFRLSSLRDVIYMLTHSISRLPSHYHFFFLLCVYCPLPAENEYILLEECQSVARSMQVDAITQVGRSA